MLDGAAGASVSKPAAPVGAEAGETGAGATGSRLAGGTLGPPLQDRSGSVRPEPTAGKNSGSDVRDGLRTRLSS